MKRLLLCLALVLAAIPATAAPVPIRMVVVTTFQHGEDGFGEMHAWLKEAPQKLPFPAGDLPLRYDAGRGLLVVSTGMGSPHAAAALMALGSDARFDLRKAYWLVAAIAGVDPQQGSLGSAAWIDTVVDIDYGFEIDAREAPKDWPTGKLPWFRSQPYALPLPADTSNNLFPLNAALRDWAFNLTKNVPLPDSAAMMAGRKPYGDFPLALKPPFVMTGSEVSGQSWWSGWLGNRHAQRWTDYWTGGKGRFVMSAMEDSGIVRALQMLGRMGRADPQRLMILRTASDYTAPPTGMTAADYVAAVQKDIPATREALAAAYAVGLPVVTEITTHWAQYEKAPPH
jgi:purine nucleoside permease